MPPHRSPVNPAVVPLPPDGPDEPLEPRELAAILRGVDALPPLERWLLIARAHDRDLDHLRAELESLSADRTALIAEMGIAIDRAELAERESAAVFAALGGIPS